MRSVIVNASGPLRRITAMPPVPGAVAIAAMFIIIKSKVYGQQSTVYIPPPPAGTPPNLGGEFRMLFTVYSLWSDSSVDH